MSQEIDADAYTRPFSLTKTVRRDPYPAIFPSNPSNSQEGKIILITGGGTGIGAAAAQVWARASAAGIIITGRRVEKLEETASKIKEINAETRVLIVKTDVSIDNDVKNAFHQTKEAFGKVPDLILLCSAILESPKLVHETPGDEWWSYMAINAKGVYSSIYHYINLQADPANPTGTVVVMGSASRAILDIQHPANGIGKLAAQRLVEFVDASYPTLRIFSLLPGLVDTPSQQEQNLPYARDDLDMTGMLTLYLSQPKADYLRSSTMSVN
ncbi:hypothetical protein EAE96_009516 [Botrytis aclada]|nr:hypothetical protein EAE96_009516 [Botrytis aclada]